jgi:ferredoxin
MATYTIQIEGGSSFTCSDETYILDAAEEPGIDLPYSCFKAPLTNPTSRSSTMIRWLRAMPCSV